MRLVERYLHRPVGPHPLPAPRSTGDGASAAARSSVEQPRPFLVPSLSCSPTCRHQRHRLALALEQAFIATVVPIRTLPTRPAGIAASAPSPRNPANPVQRRVAYSPGSPTGASRRELPVRVARHDVGDGPAPVDPEVPARRRAPRDQRPHQPTPIPAMQARAPHADRPASNLLSFHMCDGRGCGAWKNNPGPVSSVALALGGILGYRHVGRQPFQRSRALHHRRPDGSFVRRSASVGFVSSQAQPTAFRILVADLVRDGDEKARLTIRRGPSTTSNGFARSSRYGPRVPQYGISALATSDETKGPRISSPARHGRGSASFGEGRLRAGQQVLRPSILLAPPPTGGPRRRPNALPADRSSPADFLPPTSMPFSSPSRASPRRLGHRPHQAVPRPHARPAVAVADHRRRLAAYAAGLDATGAVPRRGRSAASRSSSGTAGGRRFQRRSRFSAALDEAHPHRGRWARR